MAYIHCHKCGWSQDDFYSENYNPAKFLLTWNEFLFGNKSDRLDDQFSNDSSFLKEFGPITHREVIAKDFEKSAKNIRNMKWLTDEAFRKDPNPCCPKCGSSKDLDMD